MPLWLLRRDGPSRPRRSVVDSRTFPYISDATFEDDCALACGRCERVRDMEVRLFAGCARPSLEVSLGDTYQPLGRRDVSATLWAQARCDEFHEAVALVVLEDGVITRVLPSNTDRSIRPSEVGRKVLSAGPMFLDPRAGS